MLVLLLLVAVLAKALLTFVSCDLMTLTFLSARHRRLIFVV